MVQLKDAPQIQEKSSPSSPPKQRKRGFPKWLLWTAALAAVAGYVVWRQMNPPVPEVTLTTAEVTPLTGSFTAEGTVLGKEYALSPEASGTVAWIGPKEGDLVRKGQLVLTVEQVERQPLLGSAAAAERAARSGLRQAQAEMKAASDQIESRIRVAQAQVNQAEAALTRVMAGPRQEEIDAARHRVERVEAAVEEARRTYERAKFLYEEGATAKANMEAAHTRYLTAQAELKEANDALRLLETGAHPDDVRAAQAAVQVARAEMAAAESARGGLAPRREAVDSARALVAQAVSESARVRASLQRSELRSPVDGLVSRVTVEVGGMASPAQPALVLSTREDLRIQAEISSEDAAKASKGMAVAVTSPTYPGRLFPATISWISPVGELKPDAAIRTRIVRARVMLKQDWQLFKPGMEVDVEGEATLKKAVTVASDALTFDGEQAAVFVYRDGKIERRLVRTGLITVDRTEILEGLKAGEKVVLAGKDLFEDGQEVKVRQ